MNGERTGKNRRKICKCSEDASIGKYLMKYGRYYVSANLFYHRQLHERLREKGFKVISIQKLATHPVWDRRPDGQALVPVAKPKVVWRGVGGKLKDYSAFLDALRSGKLDDSLDHAH
jgi:hypothetical protein